MASYITYKNDTILIGNNLIERAFELKNNILFDMHLVDKAAGRVWQGDGGAIVISQDFDYENADVSVDVTEVDDNTLTCRHLRGSICWQNGNKAIAVEIRIFDDLPFISFAYKIKGDFKNDKTYMDKIGIPECELKIRYAQLNTATDYDCNTIVENNCMLLGKKLLSGNVFVANDITTDNAVVVIKDSPSLSDSIEPSEGTVEFVRNKYIGILMPDIAEIPRPSDEFCNIYGYTIGVGKANAVLTQYKRFYASNCKSISKTYIMSNTWGDRNADGALCHEFLKKEIASARKLGVDVIQLDDGWQTGTTANSSISKSNVWGEGFYNLDFDFWALHKEKFPHGLQAMDNSDIELGLWFSPDLMDSFVNWEKDAQNIIRLYNTYGARYFKLDGIVIKDKTAENNMFRMLDKVYKECGGDITFNFDITAGKRLGYYYCKEYGNLFLENRYTDWGNYFPHLTLRSIWQLAEYIPTQKLQIEVLNNKRNADKYNTPFAPANYDITYLFAISIVGNPLIWMEMQNLADNDINSLSELVSVYKRERDAIANCIVGRVGCEPDGISFTGFKIEGEGTGYYLLFREMSEDDSYTFDIPYTQCSHIYSNTEYTATDDNGKLKITFKDKASFVFVKY